MPRVLSDYAKKREIFLDADCSFPVQILLRKYRVVAVKYHSENSSPSGSTWEQEGNGVRVYAVVPNERKKTVADSQRYEKPLCITQAKE